MRFILFIHSLFFVCNLYSQTKDRTSLFPVGYPDTTNSVIYQLQHYPLPRYYSDNKLMRLVNWMNPDYMGGSGQKGVKRNQAIQNAVEIQEELITNWNYGVVIPNTGVAFSGVGADDCPAYVKLANKYSNVPLHVITFWQQISPKKAGFTTYPRPTILSRNLDSNMYIKFNFNGKPQKQIRFDFPDSLIKIDGYTQKYYLEKITKCLTRPINLINENGEEPPGPYLLKNIKKDSVMMRLKDSLNIVSWEEFMADRKLHLRNTYSDCFMKEIPELKKSVYTIYTVEGGPIDRFDWTIMKKSMTPINSIYYSTPDFYPRWPKNWKDWMGPWHGWKWIESGRRKEIKDGDYLFSPFVAAGWSKKQEDDIRPGQWLGLLKCLSVIGAEFYYVGYFNLSAPFVNPGTWVWQAAMPSYAQAITSRFEDVLRNGNVLFDEKKQPVITYKTDDKHVLVAIRKHNQKEKYIISGTYQPFSNDSTEIPESKAVSITFNNHQLVVNVRRQGSVYVFEKTDDGRALFYQLDTWHENKHPDYWTKDFMFEAEVSDGVLSENSIYTETPVLDDYSNFVSYVKFKNNQDLMYHFTPRDTTEALNYLWIRYRGEGKLNVSTEKSNQQTIILKEAKDWEWMKINLKPTLTVYKEHELQLNLLKGKVDLDKLYITSKKEL